MLRTVAVAFVAALVLGVSFAACPSGCSGHGACKIGEVCECQPRWHGGDCSLRECPFGLSWVTSKDTAAAPGGASYQDIPSYAGGAFRSTGDKAFFGAGGRHGYTECSSRGTCDTSSGECQCFPGYAGKGCRKMKCPNDCSGHGMCMTNREINPKYSGLGPDSQFWDADKAAQCKCDSGYHGYDCSKRTCPVGDDPLTNCNQGTQVSDIQRLAFIAGEGYFTLTFTDPYGANFTTRPIFIDDTTTTTTTTRTAVDLESALEGLPNFAIPNVTVTPVMDSGSSTRNYDVTFVDAGNAGLQTLLECSWNEASTYNQAASSPRFKTIDNTAGVDAQRVCTNQHYALDLFKIENGYEMKESATCSNRGDCDEGSGTCTCWEGFTGEACSAQTVFF